MDTTILSALIIGGCTLLGSYYSAKRAQRRAASSTKSDVSKEEGESSRGRDWRVDHAYAFFTSLGTGAGALVGLLLFEKYESIEPANMEGKPLTSLTDALVYFVAAMSLSVAAGAAVGYLTGILMARISGSMVKK